MISAAVKAARSAPRSDPAKCHDFSREQSQRAFNRVVRETNLAVVEERHDRRTARQFCPLSLKAVVQFVAAAGCACNGAPGAPPRKVDLMLDVWARLLRDIGHDVRLLPAQYVRTYVKTNKSDAADAEAICEAVTRPTMCFVPIKEEVQQEVLVLHRVREMLIRQRTQLIN